MNDGPKVAESTDSQESEDRPREETEPRDPNLVEEPFEGSTEAPADLEPEEGIVRTLQRLTEVVDREVELRKKDQQIAERLHEENERLRQGEVREIQRALVNEIARLVDLVEKEAGDSEEEQSRFGFLKDGLTEVLASAGVVELRAEPGDAFERGLHKAVEKVPTSDEAESGRIAEVRRTGFGWIDGGVLRLAEVAVFMFEPSEEEIAGEHWDSSEPGTKPKRNTESEGEK